MTRWQAKVALVATYEKLLMMITKTEFFLWRNDILICYHSSDNHLDSWRTFIMTVNATLKHIGMLDNLKGTDLMADNVRWNPKPTLCFQRPGYGIILAVGNEVIRFDKDFKVVMKREHMTFFKAAQEAMLFIGLNAMEITVEGESNDG